jgi:hypothetical protein
MKLGIYTASVGAEDRWRKMQQRGLLAHILFDTLIAASVGAMSEIFRAFIHQIDVPLSIGLILAGAGGSGFVGLLFAVFSWRSAKKKAEKARELDA